MNSNRHSHAGLYIHVPFCKRFCLYCDFYSVVPRSGQMDDYINAVNIESSLRKEEGYGQFEYDTIFLGGGTPSILSCAQVEFLFANLRQNLRIGSNPEITIECNPSSVTIEILRCYRAIGINRVSLGVQSFNDTYLDKLGRLHDCRGAVDAFRMIRANSFDNISIDLIYGLPNQTLREWEDDIARAIELGPEHISAYNLIIEPGTSFAGLQEQGKLHLPSEETQGAMYEHLNTALSNAGFARYEISNFARPGFECRHNLKYWHLKPYLGLGPAAVSFDGKIRRRNSSDLPAYIDASKSNQLAPAEIEELESDKLREEMIMMSLRLSEGLSIIDLKAKFEYDIMREKGAVIDSLVRNKYISIDEDRICLTSQSLFISDGIIVKLI